MKIYGDLISPFVRMTMVTAHELGLSDRVQRVDEVVRPTEVNARLTSLSAIGKVPVLETDHHHAVHDSRVIIEYLCHVAGNSTMIPDDGVKRFRVLTLQALAVGLADVAVALRYETGARPQGLQWQDWIARTRLRLDAGFDQLEQSWLPCLAEINAGTVCTAVMLAYVDFRLPDMEWRNGRPGLAAFHEAFSRRDSMMKTRLGG